MEKDKNNSEEGEIKKTEIKLLEDVLTYNDSNFYLSFEKRKYIRCVCISDTHTQTDNLKQNIPDGDIFMHCGDFSYSGQPREIEKFKNFLNSLPHTKKVIIAGNHDITFDKERYETLKMKFKLKLPLDELDKIKKFEEDIVYLENSCVELYGYNIYGSPYCNKYFTWAFMKSDENLNEIWSQIPDNTDILLTHGPPMYIGDLTDENNNVGSLTLYKQIRDRIKPKFHIYGHIHEGFGCYIDEKILGTIFVNCSLLDSEYNLVNCPIVFDLPKII
jgi:Icc-related predicted phosphoesterase